MGFLSRGHFAWSDGVHEHERRDADDCDGVYDDDDDDDFHVYMTWKTIAVPSNSIKHCLSAFLRACQVAHVSSPHRKAIYLQERQTPPFLVPLFHKTLAIVTICIIDCASYH